MKLVLFDCDGTLVDSARLIHEVMVRTFRDFGLAEPSQADTHSIIGLTLDVAIARIMGEREATEQSRRMMAHYKTLFGPTRQEEDFSEPLYPGIAEMIAHLESRDDVILGAVTGKSRHGLDLICRSHGFEKTFFVSRTADDCPSKPHPAMVLECCRDAGISADSTIVVGDSIYDMEMAKSAGAKAIGVSWGYGAASDLTRAGADAIANRADDIVTLLRQVAPLQQMD